MTISYAAPLQLKVTLVIDFRNRFRSVSLVMFIFVEICIFGKIMFITFNDGRRVLDIVTLGDRWVTSLPFLGSERRRSPRIRFRLLRNDPN